MAKATTMNDNVPVLIHNRTQRNGDQVAQTHLTEAADQREKVVLAKPCVIPVLFIPGIMGTNLRNSQSKKKAWRPPNLDVRGSLDLIGQLFSYSFKSTESGRLICAPSRSKSTPLAPLTSGTVVCQRTCWWRVAGVL